MDNIVCIVGGHGCIPATDVGLKITGIIVTMIVATVLYRIWKWANS